MKPFIIEIVCIFPESLYDVNYNVVHDVLLPFNSLLERSSRHLAESNDINSINGVHSSSKEKWWAERRLLDAELENMLSDVDDRLFNYACVKEIVNPNYLDGDHYTDELKNVSGNLSLKFDAMCAADDLDSYKAFAGDQRETIETETAQNSTRTNAPKYINSFLVPTSPCYADRVVFLILDEFFHSLPLENLSTFIQSTVCRVPSIPFAISRCQGSEGLLPHIDLSKTTYILDPESNLAETRARMQDFFNDLASKNGWDWNGFVGEIPPDEVIEAALKRENSMYLFCGHGGGESILPRAKFDNLFLERGPNQTSSVSICQSALVLMGCSSGRLVSTNAAQDDFAPLRDYHFEPDGAIISYLCAGAPCVVANLWDVTDRDIDK